MMKIKVCVLSSLTVLILLLAPTGVQAQTYTDLYNFGSNPGDPIQAQPAVIAQGRDGNLYSATGRGGTNTYGTIFKITPKGKLSLIYNFDGILGDYPSGGVTLGTDGNLYGVTQGGGTFGDGIVFKVTPAGDFTVLHNFEGSDGTNPVAPPIQGANGKFYGTTTYGGSTSNYGTLYEMTPSGELTTLYMFNQSDGQGPIASLVQGTDGEFYGTTSGGGTYNSGTVFKITGTKLTTLYMFDGTDGWIPTTPLVQGTDGDFYGTTTMGGTTSNGTVFKISSKGKLVVLYSFPSDGSGGKDPEGGLVLGTDGMFYGTAYQGGTNNNGNIYRITPRGKLSVVYTFDGTDGCCPLATLVQHTSGVMYGDTYAGGTKGLGLVYSLNAGLGAYAALVPTAGKVGKTVGILGQGFKGTKAVSFNGAPATQFTVVSNTFLKATVPNGATTGLVTVTIPTGKLVSKENFRVIP
jgi:uncharacterized repeat protein (TIGR03803 family)